MNTTTVGYEEALARLEEIVTHLERGDLTLEASMLRFEEGIALSRVCASHLEQAEGRIQKLLEGEGGEVVLQEGARPGALGRNAVEPLSVEPLS